MNRISRRNAAHFLTLGLMLLTGCGEGDPAEPEPEPELVPATILITPATVSLGVDPTGSLPGLEE